MFALLISKLQDKLWVFLAKNSKLKMFPVQIRWEFASTVPFSSAMGGVSRKRSDGIAPDRENLELIMLIIYLHSSLER